jgi:hypothetical protein
VKPEKRATRLLVSTGSDEEIVAACVAQSPEALMRSAVGLAGFGLIGGSAGSLVGSLTGKRKSSTLPREVAETIDPDLAEFVQAIASGPVLVGLTSSRLMAWADNGDHLLPNVPVARVLRISTEPSSVSPTARLLVLQFGKSIVKLDGMRSHIDRFARALADAGGIRLDEY